jgi:hypothetical protein
MLCCLFGLGVFVISCAAINKYYSFTEPFSPIWTFWYAREASTAILVANIPNCWPLMRKLFGLRSFAGLSEDTSAHHHGTSGTMTGSRSHKLNSHQHHPSVRIESQDDISIFGNGRISRSDSREHINGKDRDSGAVVPLEIWQDVEVHVDGAIGDERDLEQRRKRRILDLEIGQSSHHGFQSKTTVSAQGMQSTMRLDTRLGSTLASERS